MSSLQGCQRENQGKYYYSKMMGVAEDPALRQNLKDFFESYVFKQLNMSNFTMDTFANQDDAWSKYNAVENTPYCAGFTLKTFDTAKDEYEVQFHFDKSKIPDTNLPAYNPLILAPDLLNWGLWFSSGAVSSFPYLTEFIARAKMNHPMTDPEPLFNQTLGFAPMQSVQFEDISP